MPYISDTLIQLPPETDAAFIIRVQTYITDQWYYFTQVGGVIPIPATGEGGPSSWLGYPPLAPDTDVTVWDPVGLQFVRTVTFNYENTYYYKFLGITPVIPPPSPLPVAGDLAMFGPSGTVVDTGFYVDTILATVDWLGYRIVNIADGINAQDAVTMTQLAAAVAGGVLSVNGVLPVLGNVTLTTDDIPVGVVNFYTTNPITLAYVLTGFVAGGAGPITAADTILSAFESLQFQVSAATNSLTATQIGFGSGANLLTGSANLTWDDANRILNAVGTVGLVLDNLANVFYVAQGNVGYWYTGSASTGLLSHQGFGIDFKTNEIYTMGAVGLANNNYIEVNDTASTVKISTLAGAGGTVVASAAGLLSTIPTTLGTVTSVGLLLPTEFTITVSPITTAGTLTATWTAVAPFLVLAGPNAAVPPAAPTFRALVNSDLPTVGISKGGTGQITAILGFNALSPLTTLGDTIYHDGTNNVSLAGQITATKKFLRQTGTGAVSAAPAWDTVIDADVVFSDIVTGNSAAGQHGYLKKLSAVATEYMDGSGAWSTPAGSGVGATVTIVDDTTTNATMYPTWVTANTGNLPIKVSSTKMSFNPSTGLLSATAHAIVGTAGVGYITLIGQSANPTSPAAGTLLLHSSTANGFTRMEQDNEATTNLIYGRDNVIIARNTSGGIIAKGEVVYVTGSTGNVPNIAKAKADSASTLPSVAVALDSIANNAFGQIMTVGIISSFDTSAFAVGASVWVSTTVAGGLTSTRPSGTINAVQRIGTILVSGVGNGSLLVNVAPAILNVETGTNSATWTASAVVATTYNGITLTTSTGTITLTNAKTLAVSDTTTIATNSITFAGTEVLTLTATKSVTFADTFITSGAFSITLTSTGATNVTLPTSGTLYGTLAGSITSAQLSASLSDETGTGVVVFGTSPTFKTTVIVNNPANTFAYTITPTAITAGRILNLPLTTQTETIAVQPAFANSTGAVAGTTSLTQVMGGVALAFTPKVTGRVMVFLSGDMNNSVSGDGCVIQPAYGTGAAPANGDAPTGTLVGSVRRPISSGNSRQNPYACAYPVSGLTVGTAYWFDIGYFAITGGTNTPTRVDLFVIEF